MQGQLFTLLAMSFITFLPLELSCRISCYCLTPLLPLLQVCREWRDFYSQREIRSIILRFMYEDISESDLKDRIKIVLSMNRPSNYHLEVLDVYLTLYRRHSSELDLFALSLPYEKVLRRHYPLTIDALYRLHTDGSFYQLRIACEGLLLEGKCTDDQWQEFFQAYFHRDLGLDTEVVLFLLGSGLIYRLNLEGLLRSYVNVLEGSPPRLVLLACLCYHAFENDRELKHSYVTTLLPRPNVRMLSVFSRPTYKGKCQHPLLQFACKVIWRLLRTDQVFDHYQSFQPLFEKDSYADEADAYISSYVVHKEGNHPFDTSLLPYQTLAYLMYLVFENVSYFIQSDSLEFCRGFLMCQPASYTIYSCRSGMKVEVEELF